MKRLFLFLALFCLVAATHAQHVHGEGRLDAAFDKGVITLGLALPLDVAVGFERAPKNDSEKAALDAAAKALKDAAALWQPTPTADCVVQAAEVSLPKFEDGGHADLEARYLFRCANPTALKGIETTLFRYFKRLYRLEAQRIGPTGQGKQRLTPKLPLLSW